MPFVWDRAGTVGSPDGATGVLRIEPDQVDGAIVVFRRALAELEPRIAEARRELRVLAPGSDQVSVDAALALSRRSLDGANSALRAWEGAVAQIRSIVDQLEAVRRATGATAPPPSPGQES
ncbi:hypothetical protein [Streptoalloteichus hindustanus]|uniref:PE family protein n=1 Tax=Streptoalloteichus hindustanus TaxID=2017 RepID=A0A1M4UDP0_STRHI|nr:hypothetical protein [Streptoalloteichus hindustanus]SHE54971.1 hypothetical protein SAMN05444320_101389 [Streptoalloteichus hindustanus]